MGLFKAKIPMVPKETSYASFHPFLKGLQHALGPYRMFHPVPFFGPGFSRLFSLFRHSHRFSFVHVDPYTSTFLRPFAPRALPRFSATMGALTPARLALRTLYLSNEHQPLSGQVSLLNTARPSMHSVSKHLARSVIASMLPTQRDRLPGLRLWTSRSGLRLESEGSSLRTAESSSYRTDCMFASGCSPPQLTLAQLPSATGSGHLPEGDFHPSDRACSQAHGFRPRASPE